MAYRQPYANELKHYNRSFYLNELYHHGILGQKWGIRRFQNPDGSLTEAGKKRYGEYLKKSNVVKKDIARGWFDKQAWVQNLRENDPEYLLAKSMDYLKSPELRDVLKMQTMDGIDGIDKSNLSQSDKVNLVCQDSIPFSASISYVENLEAYPGMKERFDEAADLGLKVLKNQHMADPSDIGDPDMRWWFLYEDQTFGMGMVADMINRGYSSQQVSKMIDTIENNAGGYWDDDSNFNDHTKHVLFDVLEGNWEDSLKTFAKNCEEVKKQEQS